MHQRTSFGVPFIAILVIASVAFVPGCRRAPEKAGPVEPAVGAGGPDVALTVLQLPQENPAIGISLDAVPRGLVATFNEDRAIEIADENRPDLRYTFDADLPGSPGRSPKTIDEFKTFMEKLGEGRLTDSGKIKTALGAATWASGTYSAEDQRFGDVRIFVPHPSGAGTLILFGACPEGLATVEDQLAAMREILSGVS